MAPHGEAITSTYARRNNFPKPPKLSSDSLHRTVSDITFQLSKEVLDNYKETTLTDENQLPPISEVEDAKCECCGMSEEYTPEYIERVRNKYLGKWICGLCAEAVKEGMDKNGGKIEEALSAHMNTCARFNKLGRAYPALLTAEAMRDILRKSNRAKSISPRDRSGAPKNGGIARSSSCIPAITRDIHNLKVSN
ncbi:hypothetical protein F3Y22_tig00110963pilonHSYRG00074 [Hibiscus syriacus]|uniref:Uncharacterized protein n=1 Tax=Hibiscus syriacus TaxID=106335 RepID=A0A6A2ZA35_HIBSY|nr:uncharacterized protein LOC120148543 [Hibiscus syriacus]KAE8688567.1 hypothetical protein F3Y22_tig00110963pilonHSYRG00074 [Hibiscus syriacus]